MNSPPIDMTTDSAWEEWGRRDPYFAVVTDPKFRRAVMDDAAKRDFFDSAVPHVEYLLTEIRSHIAPEFHPRKVLDFGCGVGRVLIPFAALAEEVVGLDVSASMLEEAQRVCATRGIQNVRLLLSDDDLSQLPADERFDLVHSFIVFQHIPLNRGRAILARLLGRLSPKGVAAIHLTYSKARYAAQNGLPPPESPIRRSAAFHLPEGVDPEMQMNCYNLNEILFLLQQNGVRDLHVKFIDHGGELGVFLYFAAPKQSPQAPRSSDSARA